MKIEDISESRRLIHTRDIDDARKRSDLLSGFIPTRPADYSFNYAATVFRHPFSRLADWLAGLCARSASLKVRQEVSGRGWKHAD